MIISHTLTGELHSKFDSDKGQVDCHVIDAGGGMFSFFLNHEQLRSFIATLRQIETGFEQSRLDRDIARWIEFAAKHMDHPMLKNFACDVLKISPATAKAFEQWEADDELPRMPDVHGLGNKPEDGVGVDVPEVLRRPAAFAVGDAEVQHLALSKATTLAEAMGEHEATRKAIAAALVAGKITFY